MHDHFAELTFRVKLIGMQGRQKEEAKLMGSLLPLTLVSEMTWRKSVCSLLGKSLN